MQLMVDTGPLRDDAKTLILAMQRFCRGWIVLALVSGVAVVGCGREAEVENSVANAEGAIAARAQHRWDALVEGDFDEAYAMESPAFREVYSRRAYRGRFGQQLAWTSAAVATVDLLDDSVAEVRVMVSYVTLGPDGRLLEGERPLAERWVYVDGQWWHSGR